MNLAKNSSQRIRCIIGSGSLFHPPEDDTDIRTFKELLGHADVSKNDDLFARVEPRWARGSESGGQSLKKRASRGNVELCDSHKQ